MVTNATLRNIFEPHVLEGEVMRRGLFIAAVIAASRE
jgi:hypothetical protein